MLKMCMNGAVQYFARTDRLGLSGISGKHVSQTGMDANYCQAPEIIGYDYSVNVPTDRDFPLKAQDKIEQEKRRYG